MPKTSSRNEQGFTFVEILVSMLLLSVLGLVIWSALARGQGLVQRTFQGTLEAVRVLQLDTGLRKAAGRVRVPYWERGPAAESSADGLSVPWVDGYPERFLRLERRGARLAVGVSTGGAEALFGPFEEIALDLLNGPDGAVRGIRVTVRADALRGPAVLEANFGGQPLRTEGGE